eukprot:573135-Pelagomonas_calceolata.AAC.4
MWFKLHCRALGGWKGETCMPHSVVHLVNSARSIFENEKLASEDVASSSYSFSIIHCQLADRPACLRLGPRKGVKGSIGFRMMHDSLESVG